MTNDTINARPDAPPADPRALFATAVALGGSTVGGVRPEQLTAPTPCTEFDVAQLLAHLLTVLDRVGAIGRGDDPFDLPARDPHVAAGGWLQAWLDAAHHAEAAWTDDAALGRVVRLPWATLPGAAALVGYLGEVTVHTWDLATATGQQPEWDDAVVAVAFEGARRSLPGEGRAAMVEAARQNLPPELRDSPPPFADAVQIAAGAAAIDRLVAWYGRRP